MALRPILDLDLLRTFVCIAEELSFTRAAQRVGRTPSAITLQIQKLEALVDQPLVVRSKGGPIGLTQQGHALVEKASAMLRLNDETFRSLAPEQAIARVRVASGNEYTPFYASRSIEAFHTRYPDAVVEVIEGFSCQIAPQIRSGSFDIVVCEGAHVPLGYEATEIWRGPFRWVTSATCSVHQSTPLPLSLSPADCPWLPPGMDDCFWRAAPLRALERAGREHRVVASASSMEGLYAPVIQGSAVTVCIGARLPAGLRLIEEGEGLPELPDLRIVLIKSRMSRQPYTNSLAEAIVSNFRMS